MEEPNRPTISKECSLPIASRSNRPKRPVLLAQSPYLQPSLMEISKLFHAPASRDEAIRLLSHPANLEHFITTCADKRKLGRKVLAGIAVVWPGLLKQLVTHDMFLHSNPAIRVSCLECLIDLLNSSTGPQKPVKVWAQRILPVDDRDKFPHCKRRFKRGCKTDILKAWAKLMRKSLNILEEHFGSSSNESDKLIRTKPKPTMRTKDGNSARTSVSKNSATLSPVSSCTSDTYSEGMDKSKRNWFPSQSQSGKTDSELQVWGDVYLSSSSMSNSFNSDRESVYSEDHPPEPKKVPEYWFVKRNHDDNILSSSSRISSPELPKNKNVNLEVKELDKATYHWQSTSCSTSEEVNSEITLSDQLRQEEEWLRKLPKVTVSHSTDHHSILKQTSGSSKKIFLRHRVYNTSKNAYMYNLMDFGLLEMLGDIASLDPLPDSQEIAELALRLTLEFAPDSLLPKLPKTYGKFSRKHRELLDRRPARPKHLNRTVRSLMFRINGELKGRTLLVGAGKGIYLERLMTYFRCYSSQSARELIVSTHHDAVAHARLYPGFSDINFRFSNYSTVGFHVEQEVKEFNKEDNPLLLTAKSDKIDNDANTLLIFGVDGTKLHTHPRFSQLLLDHVIWNFPTVEWSHRSITEPKLISRFLSSVRNILTPSGIVQIVVLKDTFKDPANGFEVTTPANRNWDLEAVFETTSFRVVKTKDVPKSLYESDDVDKNDLNATAFFLKQMSASDSDESYSDSSYEEMYGD